MRFLYRQYTNLLIRFVSEHFLRSTTLRLSRLITSCFVLTIREINFFCLFLLNCSVSPNFNIVYVVVVAVAVVHVVVAAVVVVAAAAAVVSVEDLKSKLGP